jgi:hypothetical protein
VAEAVSEEPQVVINPAPPLNSADKVFVDEIVNTALAAQPSAQQTARQQLIEDGLVEFIELIPLEIEDLPSSGA